MLANIGNSLFLTGLLIFLWFGWYTLSGHGSPRVYLGSVIGAGVELAGALLTQSWVGAGVVSVIFVFALKDWWDHHDDDPSDRDPAVAADGDESRLLIRKLLGNLRDRTIPQGA